MSHSAPAITASATTASTRRPLRPRGAPAGPPRFVRGGGGRRGPRGSGRLGPRGGSRRARAAVAARRRGGGSSSAQAGRNSCVACGSATGSSGPNGSAGMSAVAGGADACARRGSGEAGSGSSGSWISRSSSSGSGSSNHEPPAAGSGGGAGSGSDSSAVGGSGSGSGAGAGAGVVRSTRNGSSDGAGSGGAVRRARNVSGGGGAASPFRAARSAAARARSSGLRSGGVELRRGTRCPVIVAGEAVGRALPLPLVGSGSALAGRQQERGRLAVIAADERQLAVHGHHQALRVHVVDERLEQPLAQPSAALRPNSSSAGSLHFDTAPCPSVRTKKPLMICVRRLSSGPS